MIKIQNFNKKKQNLYFYFFILFNKVHVKQSFKLDLKTAIKMRFKNNLDKQKIKTILDGNKLVVVSSLPHQ